MISECPFCEQFAVEVSEMDRDDPIVEMVVFLHAAEVHEEEFQALGVGPPRSYIRKVVRFCKKEYDTEDPYDLFEFQEVPDE